MTKREFVKTCIRCSYASKKTAVEYAKEKDVLTEADFREVFLINERKNDAKNGALKYNKCNYDSDMLLDNLSKTRNEWNNNFDASRDLYDDELLDLEE